MGVKQFSKAGRMGAAAWPLMVGVFVLASCGSDTTSGATASTINLDATNYIVREPVTTTVAPPVEESGVVGTTQSYIVQSGDYPLGVADQFGVELDELIAFNEWGSASEFPFPGEEIQIPPGGTAQPAAPASGAVDDPDTVAVETIPAAGSNCEPGSYTIEEGDFEGRVAEKFDVTVDALRAANSGTADYSVFYVGLRIVIPAKSDC